MSRVHRYDGVHKGKPAVLWTVSDLSSFDTESAREYGLELNGFGTLSFGPNESAAKTVNDYINRRASQRRTYGKRHLPPPQLPSMWVTIVSNAWTRANR